jgi:hypothetical protein
MRKGWMGSPRRLKVVTASAGTLYAEIIEDNPVTADAIWLKLPIEGKANVWGDEIYFAIPVSAEAENPKEIVDLADVGYWPPGKAICFFFGPTPASWGREIRAASPVNVFAKVENNVKLLKLVKPGEKVRVERA